MAELALSRLMQVASEGQQKLSGRFALLQLTYDEGQSELRAKRARISNSCPEHTLAKRVSSNSMDHRPLMPMWKVAML